MYDETVFDVNNYRLICIIICFVIIFNNKLYPGHFRYKKYEKISWRWWFFTLILMLSLEVFFPLFLVSVIGSMLLIAVITWNLYCQWGGLGGVFYKRHLSFKEVAYFPYMYRVLTIYHYLSIMFTNFILCRIDTKIFLLYYDNPVSFIASVYVYFISPFFIIFLGILNIIRMNKLAFKDSNEMEK